jgi:uncharacterized protein YdeI (YjbR/CyaY-like superfamily)
MRKYTPRKATSTWSDHNKAHVKRLAQEGKMTAAGIKTIKVAKAHGMWDKGIVIPEVDESIRLLEKGQELGLK